MQHRGAEAEAYLNEDRRDSLRPRRRSFQFVGEFEQHPFIPSAG